MGFSSSSYEFLSNLVNEGTLQGIAEVP